MYDPLSCLGMMSKVSKDPVESGDIEFGFINKEEYEETGECFMI